MIPRSRVVPPTEDDWALLASIDPESYRPACRRRNGDRWEALQPGDRTWRMHDPNPGRNAGIALWLQKEQERAEVRATAYREKRAQKFAISRAKTRVCAVEHEISTWAAAALRNQAARLVLYQDIRAWFARTSEHEQARILGVGSRTSYRDKLWFPLPEVFSA